MTDVQIQNQTSNFNIVKKEFENRYDDKSLRNLCVKNITKETKENELLDLFKQFGSIENIKLKVNKNVGPYAIYAYVLFKTPEEAKRCLKQMNGKVLKGRALRIDFKKNKKNDDGNNNFNNYNKNNNIKSNSNNNSSNKKNNNNNKNKYHRKINRNNQFYNRYPTNNKRIGRNDGTLNDDNNNPNDLDTNNFIEYEQINKRPRIGAMNGNTNNGNRNMNNNIHYNNIGNISNNLDFNKLLKDYEEKKLLNNFNNDDKNNEIEQIVQSLINNMNKTSRIKLFLCDHLRQCVQYIFNRPVTNQHLSNSNVPNNVVDFKANPFNTNSPLYNQDKNNISNLNNIVVNLNEANTFNVNNGINDKEIATYDNPNISNNNNILSSGLSNNIKSFKWKGNLEMKNKENLKIIGHGLQGNVNDFLNSKITNIVISYRKKMKSIPKIEAAYYFELENKQNENIFNSYKNYFNSKDRVGLASTDEDWHIYIIFPGGPIFNEFFNQNLNNVFIGVVCYNPQIIDKKISAPLTLQNLKGINNLNHSNVIDNNMGNDNGNSNINRYSNNSNNDNYNLNLNSINNLVTSDNSIINIHNDMETGKENSFNVLNSHFHNNSLSPNDLLNDLNNVKNQNTNKDSSPNFKPILNHHILQKHSPQANDISTTKESFDNQNNVDNKEDSSDIPNWLNQFSSLAAYLVKK